MAGNIETKPERPTTDPLPQKVQTETERDSKPQKQTLLRKLGRREVLSGGLSTLAILTLPSGIVYAARAEGDAIEIEKTAKMIEINLPAMPDNYREIYVANKRDEKNIEKRIHRGLGLLIVAVGSIIGRLFLNDQEQRVTSEPAEPL